MSELLSSVGSFFNGAGGTTATALAGLGSNIFSGVQNFQQQGRYNSAQSYLNNLIQNPAAFAAAQQKYTQPLNQGLVSTITNQTNAQLAERGLGGSSAITQATLAQALAPYVQQNQQAGQQALLSSLGMIPGLKPSGGSGFANISKILAQLQTPQTNATDPWAGSAGPGATVAPISLDDSIPSYDFNTVSIGG